MTWRPTIGSRCLFVAILALLLASVGCESLYDRRLADCDRNPVQSSFPCPRGKIHHLLLGIPRSHHRQTFAGHIHVEEQESGEPLCEFDFSSDAAEGCNWLDKYDLDGYILTWHSGDQWHSIKPGHRYILTMDFSRLPPNGSSLWLYWVQ
jgi:hypothetical protein